MKPLQDKEEKIEMASDVPKNPKIGFAVLAHNRPEYLKLCLDSLFATNLYDYDITFLIQDDGSDDPVVREIIEKPRDPKYKIVRYYSNKGHDSWGAAFNKAMRKLLEIDDFDIIGSCDSDAVFHPEWLDKTMKISLWAKKNHKDHLLGPFSSFNSSDYVFHKVLGTYDSPYGKYVVKERMGAVNYFYFKDDFLKLGFYSEAVQDETLMTEKFKEQRIRYFSTHTSYVEHIGQDSVLNQWRKTMVENAVYGMNLAPGDWGIDLKKIRPYPPKVSVIMPVYNGEKYLREAIESMLSQTLDDFEFIIVNDSSTDDSVKIIKEYQERDQRIILINNNKGKGLVGALNTGLEAARGEYIARMDSDDISLPERLARQVSFMDENLDIGLCGSWVELFGVHEGIVWKLPKDHDAIVCTMLFCGAIAHPAVMIRRMVLVENNLSYNKEFKHASEDYDLWVRLSKVSKLANVPEILLRYRTHFSNMGTIYSSEKMENQKIVRSRQIKELGINATVEELNIHNELSDSSYVFNSTFIKLANEWLDGLLQANKKTKIFPDDAFICEIENRRKKMNEEYDKYRNGRSLARRVIDFFKDAIKAILPRKAVDWIAQSISFSVYFVSSLLILTKKFFYLFYSKTERIRVRLGLGTKLEEDIQKNFKIGMAVLSHERSEYLESCLNSLFKTKLYDYDITFLINDDGSKDPKVKEIINRERDSKYKIIRNFTPKGPNCAGAAINKAVKKLLEINDFDIIGWCDPDAVFHPEWLDKTLKICLWAKKNHKDHILGPFSSFNSSDYVFHKILGTYHSPFGDYVVKRQMGMLNYFYFKEDFLKLGYFNENENDETLMTNRFEKLGVRNFCTRTSYIEHIGQQSILNNWRLKPIIRAVHGMNLAKGNWEIDIEKLSPYAYYRYVKENNSLGNGIEKSDQKLDIIIPAIEKDLDVLPLTVESVRKFLEHPIGKIYIVAPPKKEIMEFCCQNRCEFIDENSVLPLKRKELIFRPKNIDRSGWIFQQLIKLNCDAISDNDFFYVIDADTVLLQPQKFESDGKTLLLISDEYHQPYRAAFQRIFRDNNWSLFSFVSHQMIFRREWLKKMREEIESLNSGKTWYKVILDNLDDNETSSFSEYETYGNWVKKNYPSDVTFEYWLNKSLPHNKLRSFDIVKNSFNTDFRSVSFHAYNKKNFKGIVNLIKSKI